MIRPVGIAVVIPEIDVVAATHAIGDFIELVGLSFGFPADSADKVICVLAEDFNDFLGNLAKSAC